MSSPDLGVCNVWLANTLDWQHDPAAHYDRSRSIWSSTYSILFNHAMAKGMLFMASGSVIHEVHHAHHHLTPP